MIYTTYFAKLKKLPDNIIPISICAKAPNWYNGIEYKKLAPKYNFFMKWKQDHDDDYYIKCFNEQVLGQLNHLDMLDEIYNLLSDNLKEKLEMVNCPYWENPNIHIAFVCYEKPDDFCHRHLISKWLASKGIDVCELKS